MSLDQLKAVAESVGGLVALGTFFFGVRQYTIAQRWKRSEFAASLLNRLATDPDLILCRVLMDWSPRSVPIPERYWPMLDMQQRPHVFKHSWQLLWSSLSKRGQYSWISVFYRDTFDAFFTYLDYVEHCLAVHLVGEGDLVGLDYWLRKTGETKVTALGPLVFQAFVQEYYPKVDTLMSRFGISWASVSVEIATPDQDAETGWEAPADDILP